MHCVREPLIGTTMAEFLACGSLVGDWFMYNYLLCVQYRGHWGPLYYCCVMGPRPGNVARGICLILWLIMSSFLWDCSLPPFLPNVLSASHRMARVQHLVSEPGDWRHTLGSLPSEGLIGRRSKMTILRKICSAVDEGPV